jgi:hypothetical protein
MRNPNPPPTPAHPPLHEGLHHFLYEGAPMPPHAQRRHCRMLRYAACTRRALALQQGHSTRLRVGNQTNGCYTCVWKCQVP